jgi:C-terminal processing protease CtpA/Prc
MRKPPFYILILVLAMFASACMPFAALAPTIQQSGPKAADVTQATTTPQPITAEPQPTITPTYIVESAAGADQPAEITGSFQYTNPFVVETYYVEQAVALNDMHGFVIHDQLWTLPIAGQTLGYLKIDTKTKTGAFQLSLPERPLGTLNKFGTSSQGVEIFAVAYSPNLAGGPFSEGDDPSKGWPSYLASVKTDTQRQEEVTGGKLVVWAPDANQMFPTGFGPDGLLFTKDDPLAALPTGWSVIDLDQKPFAIDREAVPQLTLYEPTDIALKDYSNDSYSVAFQKLVDFAKTNYAFNDIPGKAPNWDQLYAQLGPQVKTAETNHDATAFYQALSDFTLAFTDGHSDLVGGQIGRQVRSKAYSGGYGFSILETNDQKEIVVFVTQGGPAEAAGMKVGAEVTQFNGTPILDAISKVKPQIDQGFSTDNARRYQQVRYLTRAPLGTTASVTFTNPGEASQTVNLTTVPETDSFSYTSVYRDYDPNALPVEFSILPSGVGYIKMNSFDDDLNLIIRLFQRALTTFQANQVPGIIIDMRTNPGGSQLGLAGFLTTNTIHVGQLEYFNTNTGKFEPFGPPNDFTANVEQYKFNKMVLLVGQGCASACELEAYGFSQVPGMIVVGQRPSAGVEAEVGRGQFNLPEGMSFQMPTGREILPDGSIFLEGKGVQPTVKVPITADSLTSGKDTVLDAAVNQITGSSSSGTFAVAP